MCALLKLFCQTIFPSNLTHKLLLIYMNKENNFSLKLKGTEKSKKSKENKAGFINDPLDQPTVPAGSGFRLNLKFWDGRTYGLTDKLCENRNCGRPRGLIDFTYVQKTTFSNIVFVKYRTGLKELKA